MSNRSRACLGSPCAHPAPCSGPSDGLGSVGRWLRARGSRGRHRGGREPWAISLASSISRSAASPPSANAGGFVRSFHTPCSAPPGSSAATGMRIERLPLSPVSFTRFGSFLYLRQSSFSSVVGTNITGPSFGSSCQWKAHQVAVVTSMPLSTRVLPSGPNWQYSTQMFPVCAALRSFFTSTGQRSRRFPIAPSTACPCRKSKSNCRRFCWVIFASGSKCHQGQRRPHKSGRCPRPSRRQRMGTGPSFRAH